MFLHDYDSSHGTAVGYDDHNKHEKRRQETWNLARGLGRDITIHVGDMEMKIEFPSQSVSHSEYRENMQAFFDRSQTAFPCVEGLAFNSYPSTAAPSEPRTPGHEAIYVEKEEIGKGQFGKVHRVLKARNGVYYAAKIFESPFENTRGNRKRKRDEEQWMAKVMNEIDIMRTHPHVNIPRLRSNRVQ